MVKEEVKGCIIGVCIFILLFVCFALLIIPVEYSRGKINEQGKNVYTTTIMIPPTESITYGTFPSNYDGKWFGVDGWIGGERWFGGDIVRMFLVYTPNTTILNDRDTVDPNNYNYANEVTINNKTHYIESESVRYVIHEPTHWNITNEYHARPAYLHIRQQPRWDFFWEVCIMLFIGFICILIVSICAFIALIVLACIVMVIGMCCYTIYTFYKNRKVKTF